MLGEVGGGSSEDVVLLLEVLDALAGLAQLGLLGRRESRPDAVVDFGLLDPAKQARLGDPEVLGDLTHRHLVSTSECHDITSELLGVGSGHVGSSPRADARKVRSQLMLGQPQLPELNT